MDQTQQRWPDFFIVGAPKTGTTALYRYLSQHPGIHFSTFKETHVLGADLIWRKRVVDPAKAMKDFNIAPSEKLLGDASVFYLYSKEASREIHRVNPNAKIIAIVRNPISMIPSLYQQSIRTGDENQPTLSQALDMELVRRSGEIDISLENPGVMQQLYYSDVAKYSEQLERYFEVFPKENILVIKHEDLQKDSQTVTQKVFNFLGIENIDVEISRHNVARSPRSWRVYKFIKHPPKFLRSLWRFALPAKARRLVLLNAESGIMAKKKTEVSPVDLQRIARFYETEPKKLSSLLNMDLSDWQTDVDKYTNAQD